MMPGKQGLKFVMMFAAATLAPSHAPAADEDDTALINRPPLTAQIEAQLGDDGDEQSAPAAIPDTTEPASPAEPVLDASESVSPEAMPADSAPVEAAAVETAPVEHRVAPPNVNATPPDATPVHEQLYTRNRVILLIFGLVVVLLALVAVIFGQFYAAAKRRALHRKHRHAIVHAHDTHPLGRPDPDADALGDLAQTPR